MVADTLEKQYPSRNNFSRVAVVMWYVLSSATLDLALFVIDIVTAPQLFAASNIWITPVDSPEFDIAITTSLSVRL